MVRYENLTSYEDSGVVRVMPGSKSLTLNKRPRIERVGFQEDAAVSFRTYYVRPHSFRFDWQSAMDNSARLASVWSDGHRAYSWQPGPGSKKDAFTLYAKGSLSFNLEQATRPSAGAIFFIPTLLIKDSSYFPFGVMLSRMKAASIIRDEELDGEPWDRCKFQTMM